VSHHRRPVSHHPHIQNKKKGTKNEKRQIKLCYLIGFFRERTRTTNTHTARTHARIRKRQNKNLCKVSRRQIRVVFSSQRKENSRFIITILRERERTLYHTVRDLSAKHNRIREDERRALSCVHCLPGEI